MIKLIGNMKGYTIDEHSLLNKIATYIYVESSHSTSNGTNYINADDCDDYHYIPSGWTKAHKDEIMDILLGTFGEMVSDVEFDDEVDCFDVGLYHNYAMGYIEDDQSLEENR